MADDIVFDEMLGELRTSDVSGGTGGESYVAGDGIAINGNTISATGGGGEGTVTGIEASVSGGTATITATGSTTSVDIVGTGGVNVKGNTTTGEVELDAKDLSDGTQSVTKDLKEARFVEYVTYATAATQNALTLLHFSDIHGDAAALARIVAAGDALGSLVNDMICTGDLVSSTAEQISSWWNNKAMTVIGNHDVKVGTTQNALSMADRDSYYIAPFESNWSVTHTSGTSYYYKDYTTQRVRLIVLDAMLYMTSATSTEAAAQTSWLEGLLASAIAGNLHVVIALHGPKLFSSVVPCSFSKYGASIVDTTATMCNISDTIINTVASAKASGLKFVGYICGHTHQDYINDILGDGSQYAYVVTTACVSPDSQWKPYSDIYRDNTIDAFNLVTIDTAHTTVAIVRGGGANIDEELRPRETISINYGTGEVIDREIPRIQAGFRSEYNRGVNSVARYIDTETITGTMVTLQAGHAYTANVNGTITLNMETPPTSASYGLDGLLDLNLSGGTVQAGENVYLADILTANARNICAVRFIDRTAIVNVITVISNSPFDGYVVTVTSGTSDGSLYYGLATSTEKNIGFDNSLSSQTISLGNAVTNGEKSIIGRGYANTIISGGVSCTSKTEFSGVSIDGVTVLGGTMTATDIEIPDGATVTVISGGYLIPRNIRGGGLIDLSTNTGGSAVYVWPNAPVMAQGGDMTMSGVTISGGNGARGLYVACDTVNLTSCTVTGATAAPIASQFDAGYAQNGGSSLITGCTFSNNRYDFQYSAAGAGLHIYGGGVATVNLSDISNNTCSGYFASAVDSFGGCAGGGGIDINLSGTTTTVFSNCVISGNNVISGAGGGALFIGNSGTGSCALVDCLISGNTALVGAAVFVNRGAIVELSGCTAAGNIASYLGIFCLVDNTSMHMNDCVISGNSSNDSLFYVNGGTISFVNTHVSGNSGTWPVMLNGRWGFAALHCSNTTINNNGIQNQVGITSGGIFYLHGGNTIGDTLINNGGSAVIENTNSITVMKNTGGVATVIISSGASIDLTTSIGVGSSRITVLDGGCTVNGASIPAGTYTQIVSSGGSAVAS